jgi:hypothetical protein
MSLRATTPYYSSAHTAARSAGPAAGKAAAAKESAKGVLKSPWMVAVLPFVNGGLSGMVVSCTRRMVLKRPFGAVTDALVGVVS